MAAFSACTICHRHQEDGAYLSLCVLQRKWYIYAMIDAACMCICTSMMRAFMCVQLQGLQDENKALRQDNATLAGEVEQMNRVASYVGSRVAKVLAGARRANNYNAALVGELKRWNRKLEVWCCVMLLP